MILSLLTFSPVLVSAVLGGRVHVKYDPPKLLLPEDDPRYQYLNLLRLVILGGANTDMPRAPNIDPKNHPIAGFENSGQMEMLLPLMEDVVNNNVPGDFLEAGILRGANTVFMAGYVSVTPKASGRLVWGLDSFKGMPPAEYGAMIKNMSDQASKSELYDFEPGKFKDMMPQGMEGVSRTFQRLNLAKYARLVPGFFNDTLPTLPEKKYALVRLDSDIYVSIMESLEYLYPRISVGGYLVFDDYKFPMVKKAVWDFRSKYGIDAQMEWCNTTSMPKCGMHARDTFLYWKKNK